VSLATRLWLSGALLPVAVMALVLFGADRLFHQSLENALDRALLAQAAIESVSLFDGPDHKPHLHMASSPLVENVRPFAPEGVLFGPNGDEVMRYPPLAAAPLRERLVPDPGLKEPVLRTLDLATGRVRALTVTVRAPSGEPYALRLAATMLQVETAASVFHRLAVGSVVVMALVLLLVQSREARSLGRRLLELRTHVAALQAGDLDRELSREAQGDELSALRALLAEATRALKVARDARERLVADAAHELRTPLTLMRTRLDLALRRERSQDELKAALRDTREEVDRLALLATRLLDLAALARADSEEVALDLVALCVRAVEVARPEAEARGLELVYLGLEAAPMRGRPEALSRALTNLLANALRYATRHIELRLSRTAHGFELRVIDDGPGIPEAERSAVFEPFHRVRGSGPGTGLGLAIVADVARLHGGRAYVSETRGGAAVAVELAGGSASRG
jgi:signal transduction histidine kinase